MIDIKIKLQKKIRNLALEIGKKMGWINPNILTAIGLLVCLLAGYSFAAGSVFLGGALIIISGVFDTLDGAVARANNKATKFGGVLDSVADRYSDAAIIIGAMWGNLLYVPLLPFAPGWLWGTLAILGFLMVSYVRARGEKHIEKVTIGLTDRPIRMVIVAMGAFFNVLNYAVLIVVVLSHFTVFQRMVFIKRKLER